MRSDATDRTSRFILALLLAIGAIAVAYQVRDVLAPLAIGLILAYILNPAVSRLEKAGVHRVVGTLIVFVTLIAIFLGLMMMVVPRALRTSEEFLSETFLGDDPKIKKALPELQATLSTWVGEERAVRWIRTLRGEIDKRKGETTAPITAAAAIVVRTFFSSVAGVMLVLSYFVLVPIYAFFALWKMDALWRRVREAVPEEARPRVMAVFDRIHAANSAFFRGQLSVCLIKGLLGLLAFWALGLKFAFVAGLCYAVASIFPFIGIVAMFSFVTLLSIAERGFTGAALMPLGALALIEAIESFALQPWIVGKETGLHPVMVILSFMVWGSLLGLFGILMAVPLTVAAKIVMEEFVFPLWTNVGEDVTRQIPKPG